MHKRHQKILELINHRQKVSVNELSQLTDVSVVTIRHDLSYLQAQNYVKRTHGFAEILDRDVMSDRIQLNFSLKQQLAKYALKFIDDGDSIFIEGGSTNALLARELLNFDGEIIVITVCTYIAELLKEAKFDVILFGGLLQAKSESVVGPLTRMCVNHTHFNKAFLGVDGYHPDVGFTGRDMMRAEVINSVLDKGVQNYVITDSSKFGSIFPYTISANKIKHIITDNNLDQKFEAALKNESVNIYKL
ncbi:DeoR family transcriptional regulator [Utexia brackfieldae]|uniref:DeoR family transcriptional regulator n=1 Tax=Utexia brackfieldae TaxID=3074108 RepID=UPI00370D8970